MKKLLVILAVLVSFSEVSFCTALYFIKVVKMPDGAVYYKSMSRSTYPFDIPKEGSYDFVIDGSNLSDDEKHNLSTFIKSGGSIDCNNVSHKPNKLVVDQFGHTVMKNDDEEYLKEKTILETKEMVKKVYNQNYQRIWNNCPQYKKLTLDEVFDAVLELSNHSFWLNDEWVANHYGHVKEYCCYFIDIVPQQGLLYNNNRYKELVKDGKIPPTLYSYIWCGLTLSEWCEKNLSSPLIIISDRKVIEEMQKKDLEEIYERYK